MPKTTYRITLEDGTEHKRKTDRTYTHAVVSFYGPTTDGQGYTTRPGSLVVEWCGSAALAVKKVQANAGLRYHSEADYKRITHTPRGRVRIPRTGALVFARVLMYNATADAPKGAK